MEKRSSEISSLKNLGGKTEEWLNEIGIYDRQELETLGSIAIYRMLKEHGHNVTLNLVYGIEAALLGIDWRELPRDLKAELKETIGNL